VCVSEREIERKRVCEREKERARKRVRACVFPTSPSGQRPRAGLRLALPIQEHAFCQPVLLLYSRFVCVGTFITCLGTTVTCLGTVMTFFGAVQARIGTVNTHIQSTPLLQSTPLHHRVTAPCIGAVNTRMYRCRKHPCGSSYHVSVQLNTRTATLQGDGPAVDRNLTCLGTVMTCFGTVRSCIGT